MSRLFGHVQREIIYAHRFIFYFPHLPPLWPAPRRRKSLTKNRVEKFFSSLSVIHFSFRLLHNHSSSKASERGTDKKCVFPPPLFIFAASFSVSVGSYATIELIVGGFFSPFLKFTRETNVCAFSLPKKKIYPKIFIFHRSCLSPEHE